jgi:hypothetical protein
MRTVTSVGLSAMLFLGSCTTLPRCADPKEGEIAVSLMIDRDQLNDHQGRVKIAVRSVTDHPIRISRTWRVSGAWFRLQILDDTGQPVLPEPPGSELTLGGAPAYECLLPGQELIEEVDIAAYRGKYGGRPFDEPLSRYPMTRGQTYRIRAFYLEPCEWPCDPADHRSNEVIVRVE